MVCRVWFEVLSSPAVVISPLINILVCPEDEDVSESVSSKILTFPLEVLTDGF